MDVESNEKDVTDKVVEVVDNTNNNQYEKVLEGINVVVEYIKTKDDAISTTRLINDKDLVIIGSIVIAICAMFFIPEPVSIISNIITGMFGIATGRAMGNK